MGLILRCQRRPDEVGLHPVDPGRSRSWCSSRDHGSARRRRSPRTWPRRTASSTGRGSSSFACYGMASIPDPKLVEFASHSPVAADPPSSFRLRASSSSSMGPGVAGQRYSRKTTVMIPATEASPRSIPVFSRRVVVHAGLLHTAGRSPHARDAAIGAMRWCSMQHQQAALRRSERPGSASSNRAWPSVVRENGHRQSSPELRDHRPRWQPSQPPPSTALGWPPGLVEFWTEAKAPGISWFPGCECAAGVRKRFSRRGRQSFLRDPRHPDPPGRPGTTRVRAGIPIKG